MKAAAIILIILVLAAVCGIGYLYLKAELTVTFDACIATEAVTQADYFNSLKSRLASSSFAGTLFTDELPGSADQYQFLTYTVHLANHAFLKAEVIEIRVTPMQGDVLQLGAEEALDLSSDEMAHDLPSGRETDLSVTILTARDMHSVREATVSCYFWGIPFTTRLTLGN